MREPAAAASLRDGRSLCGRARRASGAGLGHCGIDSRCAASACRDSRYAVTSDDCEQLQEVIKIDQPRWQLRLSPQRTDSQEGPAAQLPESTHRSGGRRTTAVGRVETR